VDFDTTFGQGDGILDYGVAGTGNGAALFSDGNIAVITWPSNKIVKLNADGGFDAGFGDAGTVDIDLPGINDVFVSIALSATEQILVLGRSRVGDFKQAHLLRLHADGSLDVSFADNGIFTYSDVNLDVTAYDLDVGMDGRILLVGSVSEQITATSGDWFMAAILPEGQWDSGFGQSGLVHLDVGLNYVYGHRVEELSDGSILFGGSSSHFALVKTLADGSLDQSFGNNGQTLITQQEGEYVSDAMFDLLVMPDGNILCAGRGVEPPLTWGYGMFADLTTNGTLNNTFSGNGLSVLTSSGFLSGQLVSIQPDQQGRIIGLIGNPGSNLSMLARFTADGQIDTGFGTNGYFELDDDYRTLLIQPDGRAVLVGEHNNTGRICRLNLQTWTSVEAAAAPEVPISVVTCNGIAYIHISSTVGDPPLHWTISDLVGRVVSRGNTKEVSLLGSNGPLILRVDAGSATTALKLMSAP
jgi:uncharacterized delta-60 repeat protein